MFYSDVILAKRGPLARVWLAAHWERKLSKTQLLQTNIEKSVSAIMGQEVVPMALRLSGQLLLGVVRIYSRKAKYLLDDCNEALLKIKMAFRSGAVDMTSDQLAVSRNAITLQNTRTDFSITMIDPALQDWNPNFGATNGAAAGATPSKSKRGTKGTPNSASHTARITDITLPQVNYDDNWDLNSTQDGIQSQDFDPDGGLDLGLDLFDDEGGAAGADGAGPAQRRDDQGRLVDGNGDVLPEDAGDESVGVGRDASHISRGASELIGEISGASFGGLDGFGLGEMEFGGDMPDLDDLIMDDPARPRPTGGIDDTPSGESIAQALIDVTPRTANQIRDAALRREHDKAAKGGKGHKVVVDSVTELPETQSGARSQSQSTAALRRPVDDIITEQAYLPRSKPYLHLLAIRSDPTAHFLPFLDAGKDVDKGKIYTGPAGLAPELSELFTLDLSSLRRRRPAANDGESGRTPKRQRVDAGDLESEVGRREERSGLMDDFGLDPNHSGVGEFDDLNLGEMEHGGDMPAFDLDMGDVGDNGGPRRSMRHLGLDEAEITGRLPTLSRMSTPEGDGDLETATFTPSLSNPLGIFDSKPLDAQAEKSSSAADKVSSEPGTQGWSKNTVRAQKVIRSQLTAAATGDDTAPTMSFEQVSAGATRRAAAGFFFELLVLGTKNCVKLEQAEPYADIEVSAKPDLWGGNTPSVTASRSTRVGRVNKAIMG